jgi:hypothetical protein
MTPDKKLSLAENFSSKLSRCVKNAMPAVTSSRDQNLKVWRWSCSQSQNVLATRELCINMCQGHLPSNPACCYSRSLKSMSSKFSDSSLSTRRSTGQKQQYNNNKSKQNNKQRNFNNMMQWLDRFCRYEILVQKSLKTELPLKIYWVLKL